MGRIYMKKLDGTSYTCCFCHTQLADVDELISKVRARNQASSSFNLLEKEQKVKENIGLER